MPKLYERLPDSITVKGRRYPLDLGFRNVLKMMDIMARDDLLPASRDWYALRCVLVKRPPRRFEPVLSAVLLLLFGKDKKPAGERVTSFEQDADLIRAAFWQEYGVNLYRDNLHWFEFIALLRNLPGGCKYTDVLNIRVQEIPAATKYNAKEREAILKAKAAYALELTKEERQERYERAVHGAFVSMSRMAKDGEENGR